MHFLLFLLKQKRPDHLIKVHCSFVFKLMSRSALASLFYIFENMSLLLFTVITDLFFKQEVYEIHAIQDWVIILFVFRSMNFFTVISTYFGQKVCFG